MATMMDVVSLLNDALELDRIAISDLVSLRVSPNDALLASSLPLVITHENKLGLLGVLNGLFPNHPQRIAAVVDDIDPDGPVSKFILIGAR